MKYLTKNKYWKTNEEYNIDKILYLLIDRPSYINSSNEYYWLNKKNQWHRDYNLPGYFNENNAVFWFKNNKFHRKNNKPARIWGDG